MRLIQVYFEETRMNPEKILSVIIPAYNVEKYLIKTLDSICGISCIENVEVIVVNDGSKDKTVELARRYEELYPDSMVIIDKKNGGHGSTINAGVKIAKGKYFKVIDGDDWVDSNEFEMFVNNLKAVDVDLILSPFKKIYEDTGDVEEVQPRIVIKEGVHQFKEYIGDLEDFYCMHAITFKTETYKKNPHLITEHCFYVDMEFILYPIEYISSFQYLNQCVYQYRLGRPGQSVSMASKIKNKDMHRKVITDIVANCLKNRKTTRDESITQYIYRKVVSLVNIQYSIYLSMRPSNETYRELKEFKKYIDSSIPKHYLNGISKIMMVLPASYWIIGYRYRKIYT